MGMQISVMGFDGDGNHAKRIRILLCIIILCGWYIILCVHFHLQYSTCSNIIAIILVPFYNI